MKRKKGKKKVVEKVSFSKKINIVSSKLTKTDFWILSVLVLIYSVIAFYHLGNFETPQTYYHFANSGENIDLELATIPQKVSKVRYYTGPETGYYTIMISDDGETFNNLKSFNTNSTFAWEDLELDASFKYIEFVSDTPNSYLGEVQLYDAYGDKILTKVTSEQSSVLIDEQNIVPAKISYLNSTYFDEIYFATSAYQYAHGMTAMEWVHPPLGKLIMSIPIILFGMYTFTYRIMGVIAGILMIPTIYVLAKRLFKSTKWAMLAGILMTFDNFHFAQTRMGTVDSFLVLFIMLSALFMKDYIDLERSDPFKLKAKNLLLSGLFIGCAIATKWTGLYAGLALAIIFFADLFKEDEDKRKTKINYQKATLSVVIGLTLFALIPIGIYYTLSTLMQVKHSTTITFIYYLLVILILMLIMIIKAIKKDKNLKKVFLICVISFILFPIIIYTLSYVLFPTVTNYTNNGIKGIIHQIKDMYIYHSTLAEKHPFQYSWYQWPIMYKPVWLYFSEFGGNIKSTIVGIGNPFIWWFGSIAAIITTIRAFISRKREDFFITVFMLCSFIPYIFIGRAMFMYHYFPTLPFVMLAIVSVMKYITEKYETNMYLKFFHIV